MASAAERSFVIPFAAESESALAELLAGWVQRVSSHAGSLHALAAAAVEALDEGAHRCAIVAGGREELLRTLQALTGVPSSGLGTAPNGWVGHADSPTAIAMMFPGQGAQRVGLLREMYEAHVSFRERLDALLRVCDQRLEQAAHAYLYPVLDESRVLGESRRARVEAERALQQTAVCQPIMAALGLALHGFLRELGVEASCVLGHSLGELVATAAAGLTEPPQLVDLVGRRGAIMAELSGEDTGAMAAVVADVARTEVLLAGTAAVVANINEPRQTVVSGPTAAIDAVVGACKAARIVARKLRVSHAFHSPVVAPVCGPLGAAVARLEVTPPTIPIVSAIPGFSYEQPGPGRELAEWVRDGFVEHAVARVDFVGALKGAQNLGVRAFVEIGAGRTLTNFAKATLGDVEAFPVAGGRPDGQRTFAEALARLFVLGHPIAFARCL